MKNIFSKLSKNKKIIIIAFLGVVVIIGVWQIFFKKDSTNYKVVKVERGIVSQEVTETGTVKTGEEVNLAFKTSGRIEKIYVQIGDAVKLGQSLVKLESNQLYIQLSEAQANLTIAQAKLDKLMTGSSSEEIKIVNTEVSNAQIALDTTNNGLRDAYQSAINTLDDAYLKSYNAMGFIKTMQTTYFSSSDQAAAQFSESKMLAQNSLQTAKSSLDFAKNNSQEVNINKALSDMQSSLNTFSQTLSTIRLLCDNDLYNNRVSATDKVSLDTQRTYINTALANIIAAQQLISTKKSAVDSAQGQLQSAQNQLSLTIAKPRQEDIDIYTAQVKQAQAQVDSSYQQISDAIIKAPTDGQITDLIKKSGEIVQAGTPEVSFISTTGPQIKMDVYEEDVVKIKVGNISEVSFIAFPDKVFSGKILAINPAQKIIGGVVYYEVTVAFDQAPTEEIKPGMTADIKIKTDQRENVLFLPQDAINKNNGKSFVDVLKDDGKTESRQITAGLEGSDDRTEIFSGLKEGDSIVIK